MPSWRQALVVAGKELVDALRDRRTLLTVLLSSVAVGPLLLFALSAMLSAIEERGEARQVMVAHAERAPTLMNYIHRQTYAVQPAPADFREQLASSQLGQPVIVPVETFEDDLRDGRAADVDLVYASSNQRAQGGVSNVRRLLQGFSQEQATLRLAVRAVPPAVLQVVSVEDRDLSSPASRAAQFTGMVPFFVLMAVLYGALSAALDTTAGERERGSLEPLLTNPVPRGALVGGKWAAVFALSMVVALLSSLSFIPAQWLIRSESLAAMFRYGWGEAGAFLLLLLPLAAALSGVLMAIAIRSRTFKEAQASATVVLLAVSLLPLISLWGQRGELPWHRWVPALGQLTLMNRVLRDEVVPWPEYLQAAAACMLLMLLSWAYIARKLSSAALR